MRSKDAPLADAGDAGFACGLRTKGLPCTTVRVASSSWHTMATCLPGIGLSVTTPLHLAHQRACYGQRWTVLNTFSFQQKYGRFWLCFVLFLEEEKKRNLENATKQLARKASVALKREVLNSWQVVLTLLHNNEHRIPRGFFFFMFCLP